MFSIKASVCAEFAISLALFGDVKNCAELKKLAIAGSLNLTLIQPHLVRILELSCNIAHGFFAYSVDSHPRDHRGQELYCNSARIV